ncbi:hypothetical protein SKA58_15417 [Sphingomonas sp. SKA58]|nr:hypothetical protein SKA58_15417 [Sphingomonas sp. SKA58]
MALLSADSSRLTIIMIEINRTSNVRRADRNACVQHLAVKMTVYRDKGDIDPDSLWTRAVRQRLSGRNIICLGGAMTTLSSLVKGISRQMQVG